MRKLVGVLAGLVVLGLVVAGLAWWAAKPATPDAFYEPPTDRPSASGVVVRVEPFTRAVPEGASAWRILYTSTGLDDEPTIVSGTVLVPDAEPEGDARPVLAWAHGTTGVARGCAPTLLPHPWGGIPALDEALAQGWVVVATDYQGLGTEGPHPYLVGDVAARNVLDSIRAVSSLAEQQPDVFGSTPPEEDRAAVWGHSQGGHSTIFTTQSDYAPEIELVGGAAISPATELLRLLEVSEDTLVGKALSSLAMVSWSKVYDDVRLSSVVRPAVRLRVEDIASRCVTAPKALVSLAEAASIRGGIFAVPPADDPALAARMAENTPTGVSDAGDELHLFVAQGLADQVVDPNVTREWVRGVCETGETVIDLYLYEGQDHFTIVEEGSPVDGALMSWTEDRFAGEPPADACTTTNG